MSIHNPLFLFRLQESKLSRVVYKLRKSENVRNKIYIPTGTTAFIFCFLFFIRKTSNLWQLRLSAHGKSYCMPPTPTPPNLIHVAFYSRHLASNPDLCSHLVPRSPSLGPRKRRRPSPNQQQLRLLALARTKTTNQHPRAR